MSQLPNHDNEFVLVARVYEIGRAKSNVWVSPGNLSPLAISNILAEIKADTSLKSIPVVVLTSSSSKADVSRTYNLHANAYMTKPVDFSKFVELVKTMGQYWFTVVTLPEVEV